MDFGPNKLYYIPPNLKYIVYRLVNITEVSDYNIHQATPVITTSFSAPPYSCMNDPHN